MRAVPPTIKEKLSNEMENVHVEVEKAYLIILSSLAQDPCYFSYKIPDWMDEKKYTRLIIKCRRLIQK